MWRDGVDTPLNEEQETYLIGLGDVDAPQLVWQVASATLTLDPVLHDQLKTDHGGKIIWVRQIGAGGSSPATFLAQIA